MTSSQGKRTRLSNADLITLVREEGRTPDEIAEAHGITVAHVRTRLRQCGFDGEGADRVAPEPVRELVVSWYTDGDESWRDVGSCRTDGHDPDLWFAEGPGKDGRTQMARAICGACPVRVKCLDAALRAEGDMGRQYRAGVFGGMTVDERVRFGKADVA